MVKINRPFFFTYSVFLFLLSCFISWFSLSGYVDFFQSSDIIIFSWMLGLMVFGSPIIFYFSYFGFLSAIKNKPIKMNGKLSNLLIFVFISGVIISFISSVYISYDLNEKGYATCPKISWMDPNKYVKDIVLCKE
ncbi:DUF1240 domain-containing protein [Pectobacterium carotovorum]|uniref:DUF1240 domain-containing protein n=1 Tax=Pectobacterium carotovorum TaxID=554 RepID=UPI002A808ABD|nr:DUF1240 domain-containing protein [Pectobacterium carotovorum]MDY4374756.1 DUF1240 domain-containing protein [Pectobacterium carotovorum subsp. carotovorum]